MKKKIKKRYKHFKKWLHKHRVVIGGILSAVAMLFIIIQVLYPSNRLLPLTNIEGNSVGHWSKQDAINKLNYEYEQKDIDLYFWNGSVAYATFRPSDIGLSIDTSRNVNAYNYPWYLRIIPTSILWAQWVKPNAAPSYAPDPIKIKTFIAQYVGETCFVTPKDATLIPGGGKLEVSPSAPGGTCNRDEAEAKLAEIKPHLTQKAEVRIPTDEEPPKISDKEAQDLANTINEQLGKGVEIQIGDEKTNLNITDVMSWLDFPISDEGKLTMSVNQDRAREFFDANISPKIAKAPGVTKIVTKDFNEVSKQEGQSGQSFDMNAVTAGISEYLLTGDGSKLKVELTTQPPRVEYSREYSPTSTGLSALITYFAQTHAGNYSVQLTELSGSYRSASYNQSTQFTAASTYKLFVAWGTLRKIETGAWSWGEVVSNGRSISTCFDAMLTVSDNACAVALLNKYNYNTLTNDIHALGFGSSGFPGGSPITTAADLASFLVKLQSGQLGISSADRSLFINTLSRNVYRSGIPSGVSGTVADKVGFIYGYLHDAAIVYAPSGTYVLVIMTNGSSWSKIAELTRQIEALRVQ